MQGGTGPGGPVPGGGIFLQNVIFSGIDTSCRAAIPHPINGEIYTYRYDKGWIGRYDPVTGDYKMDEIQMPYGSLDLFVAIHPKGYYMYIMVRNKHVIYRADYDFDEKTFLILFKEAKTEQVQASNRFSTLLSFISSILSLYSSFSLFFIILSISFPSS